MGDVFLPIQHDFFVMLNREKKRLSGQITIYKKNKMEKVIQT